MIVARSLGELNNERNSVVTVGTFDGVHRAHQEIVREVVHRARMKEGRSVVVTFDPHPKEVVGKFKEPIQLLTTIEERVELLASQNVDILLVLEFTLAFSQQSSREFYERYLVQGTGVSEVVVGYDHMFGRNREGSIEELIQLGQQFDFSVFAIHPYTVHGEVVSSTQVRRAIAEGNVERAKAFLGRDYSLRGTVVKGDERGRTIGYPTANILPESRKKMIPENGVYLVGATLEGVNYFGMMNIGVRPTVSDSNLRTVEVHLLDFSETIYGKNLTVTFLKKLRNEQKFSSLQELVAKLDRDKAQ